jgi:hypothetical protein
MVTLIKALGSFSFKYILLISNIHFLGQKYDGDIRIGIWQVGFLGHWGEWHTWPNATYFASKDHQDQIISAFNSSFTKTIIQIRYFDVTGNNNATNWNVGFHDDSFAQDTYGEYWTFYNRSVQVGADNQWHNHVSFTAVFSLCMRIDSS